MLKSKVYETAYQIGLTGNDDVSYPIEYIENLKEWWRGIDNGVTAYLLKTVWYIPVVKNGINIQVARHGDFLTICDSLKKEGYGPTSSKFGQVYNGRQGSGKKEMTVVI